MSAAPPSVESVAKDVEGLKQNFVSMEQRVSSMDTKLDAIAAKVGAPTGGNQTPPAGAAGKQEIELIKKEKEATEKELTELKSKVAKEKAEALQKQRQAQAESIVKLLFKDKKLSKEALEKKIKEYVDMKNEDGTPKDLDLLEGTLKSLNAPAKNTESTEGEDGQVTGAYGDNVPELAGDHDGATELSNTEIFESMRVN